MNWLTLLYVAKVPIVVADRLVAEQKSHAVVEENPIVVEEGPTVIKEGLAVAKEGLAIADIRRKPSPY
jgi:hypothetical protein